MKAGIFRFFIAILILSGCQDENKQVSVVDYVESQYTGFGVTIVSIGSSIINIGIPGITTNYTGSTSYSTSPIGINTVPLTFYRINS